MADILKRMFWAITQKFELSVVAFADVNLYKAGACCKNESLNSNTGQVKF
jgi:hypothetical protein